MRTAGRRRYAHARCGRGGGGALAHSGGRGGACALPQRAVRRQHPGPAVRHLGGGWRRRVQHGGSQAAVAAAAHGALQAFSGGDSG